jgi:TIR domain
MDIEGVALGLDFRDQLRNTLQRSDILLAIIGPQWLAVQKETGQPRIADETDWVRLEIEAALGKKIPVIPVLIDRTPLPKPNELPEALRQLAYRTNVDTGVDFQTQMDRMIHSMDELLGQQDNGSRSNAELSSNQVERSTGNNRSPLTLLGNTQSRLAQRRMSSEISSRTAPIREMMASSRPG